MENRLKKGLGRGLSSLLGDAGKKVETNKVSINDIKRNKFQPRKTFSKESLEELTNSIKEQGIIQPIVVRPDKSDEKKYDANLSKEPSWITALMKLLGSSGLPIFNSESCFPKCSFTSSQIDVGI